MDAGLGPRGEELGSRVGLQTRAEQRGHGDSCGWEYTIGGGIGDTPV